MGFFFFIFLRDIHLSPCPPRQQAPAEDLHGGNVPFVGSFLLAPCCKTCTFVMAVFPYDSLGREWDSAVVQGKCSLLSSHLAFCPPRYVLSTSSISPSEHAYGSRDFPLAHPRPHHFPFFLSPSIPPGILMSSFGSPVAVVFPHFPFLSRALDCSSFTAV